jgi:hypothetical protein
MGNKNRTMNGGRAAITRNFQPLNVFTATAGPGSDPENLHNQNRNLWQKIALPDGCMEFIL